MATGTARKVTEPLNDLGRTLVGDWQTSATTNDGYPKSACLADLVYAFLEDECQEKGAQVGGSSKATVEPCCHKILNRAWNSNIAEDESNASFGIAEVKDILQGLVSSIHTDFLEALLHKEVATAVDTFKENQNHAQDCKGHRNGQENSDKVKEKRSLKVCVMDHLRGAGYNAGICKSRWEQGNGFTAGEYEYVDVVVDGTERILVGINFRMEFVIARPTRHYNALLQILPEIFVGKAERLKQMVEVMCDSAKKSLKKRGMHLPPWRKCECMHAKWLGPYQRTIKVVPSWNRCRPKEWLGREIGKNGREDGFWGERRGRRPYAYGDHEGEGEWMPPPLMMCAVRGAKVSALASAFNEACLSCLTT